MARQSEKSDATILVATVRARNTNTAAVKPLCNDRRKKASSEKRSFCRTGCFQARHRWRVGRLRSRRRVCRSQDPRTGQTEDGSEQPELGTGNGDCSRKSKAFRSEMAARWILEAIVCEVCQPVRNLPVGAPVMPVGDGLGGLIRIARSPNTMFRVGIEK
jgi:hypothetical protein